MKIRYMLGLLLVLVMIGPQPVTARLCLGGGMAYDAMKLKVVDNDDRYFHTVLQSTIGIVNLDYEHAWYAAGLEVGWSDWNVSGQWQGTNILTIEGDELGWWLAQQYIQLQLSIQPMPAFFIGGRYRQQRWRQHQGAIDVTFLDMRESKLDLFARYNWYHHQGITFFIETAYAVHDELVIRQDTLIPENVFGVQAYREQTDLNNWVGKLGVRYRDQSNWQLSLSYSAGYAVAKRLQALKELSWVHGSIQGWFAYYFW